MFSLGDVCTLVICCHYLSSTVILHFCIHMLYKISKGSVENVNWRWVVSIFNQCIVIPEIVKDKRLNY